jgi:hypothetical protein
MAPAIQQLQAIAKVVNVGRDGGSTARGNGRCCGGGQVVERPEQARVFRVENPASFGGRSLDELAE